MKRKAIIKKPKTDKLKSAKELGVEFPSNYCPAGEPHHWLEIAWIDKGILSRCLRCQKHIWLPGAESHSKLDTLIDIYGRDAGYRIMLDSVRPAKIMIAKLQDLWYARKRIVNDRQFIRLVAEVMNEKEYDIK